MQIEIELFGRRVLVPEHIARAEGLIESFPVPCTLEHARWQRHCDWMLDNVMLGYIPIW